MLVDVVVQDKKGLTEAEDPSGGLNAEQKENIAHAEDILRVVTAGICRKNIFFHIFTKIFVWVPVRENILLETDGYHLFYQPERLIRELRKRNIGEVEKCMMHIICHGILGHFGLRDELSDTAVADMAMDGEVLQFGGRLGLWTYRDLSEELGEKAGTRRIYQHLRAQKKSVRSHLQGILSSERKDDHHIWNREKEYHYLVELPKPEGMAGGNAGSFGGTVQKLWIQALGMAFGEGNGGELAASDSLAKAMSQGGRLAGDQPGNQVDAVRADPENGRSYREVLERFFREEEGFREKEDTIDRMLYTYGFEMYDNVALIEPEECSEYRKLNTLAIAVDTSGSTYDVMPQFLRETKNILRDICANGSFEEILFLECDAVIQKETAYKSPEELPEEDSFRIHGYGGTDFRPVFRRLDELVKRGKKLDCLIFLTDGLGEFPDRKPDYPTFLILSEKGVGVPAWAEKIYLD